MGSYNVIFLGDIAEGFELEEVTASLEKRFGISGEARVQQFFSGSRIVLRKEMDQGTAEKFRDALGTIGLVTQLEPIESPRESDGVDDDAEPPATDNDITQISDVETPSPAQAITTATIETTPTEEPSHTPDLMLNAESAEIQTDEPPTEPTPEAATAESGLSLEPLEPAEKAPSTERPIFEARDAAPPESPVAPEAKPANPYTPSESTLNEAVTEDSVDIEVNSSGGGSDVSLPSEAAGLCWGGFFFGWIWAVFNRSWLGLLGLIPLLNLAVAIVLLFKGREWAWKNKRWESVEHFNAVQRKWSIAGIVLALLSAVLWIQLTSSAS